MRDPASNLASTKKTEIHTTLSPRSDMKLSPESFEVMQYGACACSWHKAGKGSPGVYHNVLANRVAGVPRCFTMENFNGPHIGLSGSSRWQGPISGVGQRSLHTWAADAPMTPECNEFITSGVFSAIARTASQVVALCPVVGVSRN